MKTGTTFIALGGTKIVKIPTKTSDDAFHITASQSDSISNFDARATVSDTSALTSTGNSIFSNVVTVPNIFQVGGATVSGAFQMDGSYHLTFTGGTGYALVKYIINS